MTKIIFSYIIVYVTGLPDLTDSLEPQKNNVKT